MANNKNTENNVTFSDNKKYHVMIPFELLEFLSDDYSYKNKSRFSRLQAFQNLVESYYTSWRKQEDMAVNIERLSKTWRWSRPSVMKFVQFLEAKEVLEVFNVITSKIVRLRKEVVVFLPQES
ncbi:hypothetical protein [Prevotella nigrescens]|uniref:hypothetical protein n=1 Tax=Prevotella nigrescens TaxID=28133 RepID=UPI0028DCF28E|nr:hypothetical protein [Prevotella nigrescens]